MNSSTTLISETSFSFDVGQLFRRDTTVFRIAERYGNQLTIEHVVSFERRSIEIDKLYQEYLSGNLIPCTEKEIDLAHQSDLFVGDEFRRFAPLVADLSDAVKAAGFVHIRYIKALRELGYTNLRPTPVKELELSRLARRFEDAEYPKLSTLYRWSLELDKKNGDWRAVFPSFYSRGKSVGQCISPVAAAAINTVFDRLERNPKEKIFPYKIESEAKQIIQEKYGPDALLTERFSRSSVERLTKAKFGLFQIMVRNKGLRAANAKYRYTYPVAVDARQTFDILVTHNIHTFPRGSTYGFCIQLECNRTWVSSGNLPWRLALVMHVRSLLSRWTRGRFGFPHNELIVTYGTFRRLSS